MFDKLFQKEDMKALHFARKVSAGTTGSFKYGVQKDGTIESLTVRIYSGAEDQLRLNIYVLDQETDSKKKVVETPDEQGFIGGNEDVYEFDVSKEVTSDDFILIEYENDDGSNPHRYKMNLQIDRTGGTLSNILR